jgi:PST family polysaccharide transporter
MAERKAIVGTVSMAAANILKLGLQFLYLPVLAHLLDPASFGLVALAWPFILLASMVSDAGLGIALIRHAAPSRELESTVFWLSIFLGLVLAGLVSLAAGPIGRMMAQPNLPPILIAFAAVLPVGGAMSVANARISRTRRFSLFAIGDVASTILSYATAIAMAFAGWGPWSLIAQQFVLWGVKAIWLIPNSGFRPKLFCRPSLTFPYLRYGLNAVGSSLFDFATKNVPTLIIGSSLGVTVLGYYSIATQIIRVPDMVISGPIYLPVFTAVAQNDRGQLNQTALVMRGLRGLVMILAPIFCGLTLTAGPVVDVLFGIKWAETAPMLALLTPCGLLFCLYSFAGAVFMGMGRSDHQLKLTALMCALLIAGTLIGAPYGGPGVALGLSVAATLAVPLYLDTLAKELHVSKATIGKEIAPPLIATGVMATVLSILATLDSGAQMWLQLSIMIACGMIAYLAALAAISWRRLEEDIAWLFSSKSDAGIEVP